MVKISIIFMVDFDSIWVDICQREQLDLECWSATFANFSVDGRGRESLVSSGIDVWCCMNRSQEGQIK